MSFILSICANMHNPLSSLPGIVSKVAQHPSTEASPLKEAADYLVFTVSILDRDLGAHLASS